MKRIKYLACVIFSSLLTLTSCLNDGEETIALEKGELDNLLYANWKVTSCQLYDTETGEYHSELINDSRINQVYILDKDGNNLQVDPDGNINTLLVDVDAEDHTLSLDEEIFRIESIGKALMLLERYADINGEHYKLQYYLTNIGTIDDLHEIESPDDEATCIVSTNSHGFFERNGYGFTIPVGAVPKGDNGQNGTVAFSAHNVAKSELPGSAPDQVSFIEGSGIYADPSNFIFATPIIIEVPLKGNSVVNTNLYHWNGLLRKWEIVPFSSLKSASKAQVSVIELGYFVLGTTTTSQLGGIKVTRSGLNDDYYYYLTLKAKGGNGSTSIAFSANGGDLYMANVPLGEYEATISRERRSQLNSAASTLETANKKLDIIVRNTLTQRGTTFAEFSGWTVVNLSSVQWNNGRPDSWGSETVTYGTGVFQATLNWINYSGSTTDYDLHLTTPNGTEIYYSHRNGDGFELDRDVISDLGNCIENIYSVSESLPRGTYTVRVHHFSGATGRSYNCRVILQGRVVSSYTGITDSGYQEIYKFTLQ